MDGLDFGDLYGVGTPDSSIHTSQSMRCEKQPVSTCWDFSLLRPCICHPFVCQNIYRAARQPAAEEPPTRNSKMTTPMFSGVSNRKKSNPPRTLFAPPLISTFFSSILVNRHRHPLFRPALGSKDSSRGGMTHPNTDNVRQSSSLFIVFVSA